MTSTTNNEINANNIIFLTDSSDNDSDDESSNHQTNNHSNNQRLCSICQGNYVNGTIIRKIIHKD